MAERFKTVIAVDSAVWAQVVDAFTRGIEHVVETDRIAQLEVTLTNAKLEDVTVEVHIKRPQPEVNPVIAEMTADMMAWCAAEMLKPNALVDLVARIEANPPSQPPIKITSPKKYNPPPDETL